MIKKYFPIFNNQKALTKNSFIFLDSAATSQKPQMVIDAISNFYTHYNSNVRRGLYPMGEHATKIYEQARHKVARFIHTSSTQEIVFTKGTTEGINLVAQAWAMENLSMYDEILITQAEHHANLLPWQQVTQKTGATLKYIPINKTSYLADYDKTLITNKTKLVAVTHSSNVLGTIWPSGMLQELIKQAHNVGAKILLDGAQTVIHEKIDVQSLNIDFFVFSGHKMFAPTGVGVLYINKQVWKEMVPYQRGGSMIHSVNFDTASWAENPHKFEAGTPPISSAIGLGADIDFINTNISFKALQNYEASLCNRILDTLLTLDDISIIGNIDYIRKQGHLIAFTIKGIHPHDLASYLGKQGVCIRAGHHCAQPLITLFGFDSLVRISVSAYNSFEDVDYFIATLQEAISFFKSL